MKTNKPNWDYEKPAVIVSEIVKLCAYCGSRLADSRAGVRCPQCHSTEYHEVFEHMAHIYRNGLKQIEEEIERAALEVNWIYGRYSVTEAIVDAFVKVTERPEYDATPEQEQQATSIEKDVLWLGETGVSLEDGSIQWKIGNDVIFGSKEWFDNISEIEP